MNSLPILDIVVIIAYLGAMMGIGFYFSKKNKNAAQYTIASGKIPGWAIGVSIFATFLSSNTFLGVPGKAFGSNWNAFVFSLSMPLAAWVAAKYFVPFYRKTGEISAYTHLEKRFGPWARTYVVICFLLTQFARMGSIFFGIALSLQALTGFSMASVMVVMGLCIIVYTVVGGMEAIIWTEVVQAFIKVFGALLILGLVISDLPGGFSQLTDIALTNEKISLGSPAFDFQQSTFWMVMFYGFFINLNNFGMDQNYVQRYHTAQSQKQAAKSVWLCVAIYVPVSLMFFVIGTALFAWFQVHGPEVMSLKMQIAGERLGTGATASELSAFAAALQPADYGDRVLPWFMVNKIPAGIVGLIISAILSAAMSTISSGMNASATVFSIDIYKKYINPNASETAYLRLLKMTTVVCGVIGLAAGIAMIGSKSILDTWWELSGIFAGGMLGLFLLGLISRSTQSTEALLAVAVGIVVILWMTFSDSIPTQYAYLRSALHKNMIIVVGTLTIFFTGLLLTRARRKKSNIMPA